MTEMIAEPVGVTDVAPSLQTTVAAAWRAVLHHENFTMEQDFFDVGGNSMLLIAMLELLQEQFDKEIDMAALAEGVSVLRLTQLFA